MRKLRPWVTSVLLATAAIIGKRTVGVLAVPHAVVPVPRTTDALSLTLYVKSSKLSYSIVSHVSFHDAL